MNPKVKRKWIKALRSGKYRQGFMHLCKNDCYCVVGVLCDLAAKEGVVEKKTYPLGEDETLVLFGTKDTMAVDAVTAWAELPDLRVNNTSLYTLNDIHKYNFDQLATLIEEQL